MNESKRNILFILILGILVGMIIMNLIYLKINMNLNSQNTKFVNEVEEKNQNSVRNLKLENSKLNIFDDKHSIDLGNLNKLLEKKYDYEDDGIDYVDLTLTCFIVILYVMLVREFYKLALKYFSHDGLSSDKIDSVVYNYMSLDDDRSVRNNYYFDSSKY